MYSVGLNMNGYCQQIFSKTYGHFDFNYGKDVIVDTNGYYILGNTGYNNGNSAPMLIRTDTAGIIQKLSYQPSTQITSATKFYKTHDKLYVCGSTNNTLTNDYDCFLSIYDTSLTLIRSINFGGSSWDFANDITGFDTSIYVVGQTYSTSNGFSWGTISKFNLSGDSLDTYYYGIDGEALINSLTIRGDTELLFTGQYQAPDSLFPSAFIASANPNMILNWNKNLSADLGKSVGNDIELGIYNIILICGSSEKYSSTSIKDAFIYTVDVSGNYIRHEIFTGTVYAKDDEFLSIARTELGDFYITGNTNSFGSGSSDILFFKVNFTGYFLWSTSWGEIKDDISSSIKYSPSDTGFVVCGTSTFFGNFNSNILLIKTSQSLILNNNPIHELNVEDESSIASNISCYPNPTIDNITISCGESNRIKFIELFDIRGQKISAFKGNESENYTIDIAKVPSQLLLLKISTDKGVYTKKIIKQ